jgi:AcrR family transcriptional regulator
MNLKKLKGGNEIRQAHRMAAEDRRQQILDVAVRLFSQKGFRGTTTKEIALAAGVNEAIIFRHFVTKRELYSAIIDQKASSAAMQAKQQALNKAISARDDRKVFESLAFNLLDFHDHDDTAMRLLLYSALEGHELAEMIFRNHILKTHREVADYVKSRMTEGAFRQVDPMTAVRGFLGMVINHVIHKKFFRQNDNEILAISNRQMAERLTDFFLASMTNHNFESQRTRRKEDRLQSRK